MHTPDDSLKPCPFCGNAAYAPECVNKSGSGKTWRIACLMFCCSMHRKTKRDAIRDWNTRKDPDIMALQALERSL